MTFDLAKMRSMVEQSTDLTSQAREASERDRDYYDEHQYTAEQQAVYNARKQPAITNNLLKRKIDAMVGIEQQGRTDPRAYARRPNMEEAAEAATKALVFVDDNTRFDNLRSQAFENLAIEGYGGVEVVVETKRGQLEIAVNRLRWEEIFYDPHSREKDFSDAAYMGTMKWMSHDAAFAMLRSVWQGSEDDLADMLDQSLRNPQDGETFEDRPFESNSFRWADRRLKRVRVAQMYYQKDAVWHLSYFCGGGEIYNEVSPYLDEDGEPCCPIKLMTAYIDRENRRYGVLRSMIGMQDEVNQRRSRALWRSTTRQTIGVKGAVESVAKMKRELNQPDGHVEINIEAFEDAMRVGVKPFEILDNQDQTAVDFQLLQQAQDAISQFGPNPALLGEAGDSASGRAIMARQQAGFAELAPVYDSLRDWTLRVYRAMWERIKQFWTEERWIRVTETNGKQMFIGLNVQQAVMTEYGPQMTVQNPVAEMDVDIVIEDVQDYATLQQETFEQLATLAQQGMPIPPQMLIEASAVNNKREILDMLEQQQQAQQQQEQQQQQRADVMASVEIDKTQSEAEKNRSQAMKNAADAQRSAWGL